MNNFDYDMTVVVIPQSLSPGNEQREFFGSAAADQPGSQNQIGIKSKVVDGALIEQLKSRRRPAPNSFAHTPRRSIASCNTAYYLISRNTHLSAYWVAYWDKFPPPANRRPNCRAGLAPGGSRVPAPQADHRD